MAFEKRKRQVSATSVLPSFLRDARVLQAIGQIVFVILVVTVVSRIGADVSEQLRARNLAPTFGFLSNTAGFDIAARPDWYSSQSTYGQAFIVGLINTFRIVSVGLVSATIMGIVVGILLLSRNWLVRTISRTYVEIVRNTPLLIQLFVWYFVVMFSLPTFQQSLTLPSEGITLIGIRIILYAIAAYVVWRYANRYEPGSYRNFGLKVGFIAALVAAEIGFRLAMTNPEGFASRSLTNYLIYLTGSLVALGIVWFIMGSEIRALAIAILGGQLIGGSLFYWGIIPDAALRLELYPLIYASIRGFAFPEIQATARFAEWMAFVGLAVALSVIIWIYYGRMTELTGRPARRGLYVIVVLLIFVVGGWFFVTSEPILENVAVVNAEGATILMPLEEARSQGLLTPADELQYAHDPIKLVLPQRSNFRFTAGSEISPEYMALLLGLVVYTSSFIAEIVRAGIQAVPYGQIEAARAVGLSGGQTLRLIVLPQALRVIIPPLGNQYLNLSKNSSLALAIAFDDVFKITTTIMNQSGQSITGIFMVMITYLIMSLSISFVTNVANRRFQLVTR